MGFSKELIRELEDPDWDLRAKLAKKLHLTTDEGVQLAISHSQFSCFSYPRGDWRREQIGSKQRLDS